MKKYYINLTEQERSQIIHSLIDKKNAFTQFIFQNRNFFYNQLSAELFYYYPSKSGSSRYNNLGLKIRLMRILPCLARHAVTRASENILPLICFADTKLRRYRRNALRH